MPRFRVAVPHKIVRLSAPPMPGPFVNAKLLSLGCDEAGVERFWNSVWNACSGTYGVVADEAGGMATYPFGLPHRGFYSAVPEDDRTLWLCGDLSCFVRLHLDTKAFECFSTDAVPGTPVFAGMAYDGATRRIFVGGALCTAAIFDIRTGASITFKDQWQSRVMYHSFPNGDGSWSLVFQFPGALKRWNPQTHEVTPSRIGLADVPLKYLYRTVHDDLLGEYLPTLGWYDSVKDRLRRGGPRPQREMLWFGRHGRRIFGCEQIESDLQVAVWDMESGHVENRLRIPDTPLQGVALSRRGDIVAMSIDGTFRIHDGEDMGLKLVRPTRSNSVGAVDCLRLIDRNRLLGTTFITQRFWEADLDTRRAWDCGRAAPKSGEILKTWRIGRLIYMAAYHGGELMEYDPRRPASFPVNPRVVAQHPNAMRPIAAASHGRIIWYACSREYGTLGSVLFRYDTRSGVASWAIDPLGPRRITSLLYDHVANELICGTSVHADQRSADPTVNHAVLARIGADDLAVRVTRKLPPLPLHEVKPLGWLRRNAVLCMDLTDSRTPRVINATSMSDVDETPPSAVAASMADTPFRVVYCGKPGQFLLQIDGRLEWHDLGNQDRAPVVLIRGMTDERLEINGKSLLLSKSGKVMVLHDIIPSSNVAEMKVRQGVNHKRPRRKTLSGHGSSSRA